MLCDMTGRSHVVLLGRAAAGIWAALRVWGIHGQMVWIPANTCYIVLWAVLESGNTPVLVDVDSRTGNISPDTLTQCVVGVNRRFAPTEPAVIIPCHMYGLSAPMAANCEWAAAHEVKVIEDAAQASGGHVDGRPAGAWGDASIFSFGQGKIVDVELGGALLTDDPVFATEIERVLADAPTWNERLAELSYHWEQLYWPLHQFEDENPRLLNLYPALFDIYRSLTAYRLPASYWDDLPVALRKLPENRAHRMEMAALYDQLLHGLPVRTLARPEGSILWRYPLLVPANQRRDLLHFLWERKYYEVTRWYPSLRWMHSALAPDAPQKPTPGADQLAAEIINLPVDGDEASVKNMVETIAEKICA
jgi:dTDP-4-amino-4,6-dideoxygalactose transaminase